MSFIPVDPAVRKALSTIQFANDLEKRDEERERSRQRADHLKVSRTTLEIFEDNRDWLHFERPKRAYRWRWLKGEIQYGQSG